MLLASVVLAALLADHTQDADVPPREREVLMELFAAAGGEHWQNRGGWGTTLPVCSWAGVQCSYVDGYITQPVVASLWLGFNGLRGTLPGALDELAHLDDLDLSGNELTGAIPPGILRRWDQHTLGFRGDGNRFANMVATAAVEVQSSGTLCSTTEDLNYKATFDATTRRASMESVRCVSLKGRQTVCVVRRGMTFSMDRLSSALARLRFDSMNARYDYASTFTTHQQNVTTTVTWGDGRDKTVSSYGRQGPLEAWMAQQLFLSLIADASWTEEFRTRRCSFQN